MTISYCRAASAFLDTRRFGERRRGEREEDLRRGRGDARRIGEREADLRRRDEDL